MVEFIAAGVFPVAGLFVSCPRWKLSPSQVVTRIVAGPEKSAGLRRYFALMALFRRRLAKK